MNHKINKAAKKYNRDGIWRIHPLKCEVDDNQDYITFGALYVHAMMYGEARSLQTAKDYADWFRFSNFTGSYSVRKYLHHEP